MMTTSSRRTLRLAVAAAACIVIASVVAPARADVAVSFDLFHSNLSPHGSWLISASYGRVWQPAVYDRGWNPYYDGHWEHTDLGWTWVSDYAWGAIPYHYGTWALDADLGWVWVPGYVWAPSWVVFRVGAGTIGWAPVPPNCTVGASWAGAEPPPSAFVFVPDRDFAGRRIRRFAVSRGRAREDYRRTRLAGGPTIRDDVVVNLGVNLSRVERSVRHPIRSRPITTVPRATPFRQFARSRIAVPPHSASRPIHAAQPEWGRGHETPERGRPARERPERPDRGDGGRGHGHRHQQHHGPHGHHHEKGD